MGMVIITRFQKKTSPPFKKIYQIPEKYNCTGIQAQPPCRGKEKRPRRRIPPEPLTQTSMPIRAASPATKLYAA